MNKFYIFLFVLICLMMVYWAGVRYGDVKCTKILAQDTVSSQLNIIKTQEKINEEAVVRSTDDIRRVLYDKYTIAQ